MNIKQGYKQTEIGIIPEDWDLFSLGDLFDFKNGLNKEKKFFGKGTPIVNYMDIYKHRGLSAKDIVGKVTVTKEEIKNYSAQKGDVFFTRTSETVDEIGIASVIIEDIFDTVFSGFILRARPKNRALDEQYKKYCFSTLCVRKEIKSKSSYTTRALTNGRLLSQVKLPIPPLKEQTAIATALSDIDALIGELDKLIAKKQGIKQATMQQLLTGKKRLAGFSGEWEVKRLGELCEKITTGKLDANAMSEEGEYPFFTCAKENYWIDNYAFDSESLLISGNGANVGYVHYYKGKFNAYQRTYVLSGFYVDIQFLKFFLQRNLHDRIRVEVNAGSTPYIVMNTLTEMDIYLPNNQKEQTAIANILSDMDAEISQLEGRRAKMGELKQGMMQELLTGRIRLTGVSY